MAMPEPSTAVPDKRQNFEICETEGCKKLMAAGGHCRSHGGWGTKCRTEGCLGRARTGGHCLGHGGTLPKCKTENCEKQAASGGLCRAHGGGRRCGTPGCSKAAEARGHCSAHGGCYLCQTEGCTKQAKSGGHCKSHGGGMRCKVKDCLRRAHGGGRCITHGGGKRCTIEGCTRSDVGGGACIAHGGGYKCQVEGCTTICQTKGGRCSAHKKKGSVKSESMVCIQVGCGKPSELGGSFCTVHAGIVDLKAEREEIDSSQFSLCGAQGCERRVQRGNGQFCGRHRPCAQTDCTEIARSRSEYCASHQNYSRSSKKKQVTKDSTFFSIL